MENSTFTLQPENSSTKHWPKAWLERAWILALHRKFSMMYLTKFTSCFPDDETVEEWCSVWGERLGGMSGEQIKHGLERVTQHCEWPPTLHEFKQWCEVGVRTAPRGLPAPARVKTEYAAECMAVVKQMLTTRRKPGNWWAFEVMAKHERNEPVTMTALNLAKSAIEIGRARGQPDPA